MWKALRMLLGRGSTTQCPPGTTGRRVAPGARGRVTLVGDADVVRGRWVVANCVARSVFTDNIALV
jgi:hypothetical protein